MKEGEEEDWFRKAAENKNFFQISLLCEPFMFSLDFQADYRLLEFLLHSPLDPTMKPDRLSDSAVW